MAFEVEKDVPLPTIIRRTKKPPQYPFESMGIGDSFFCPGEGQENLRRLHNRLIGAVARQQGQTGQRFSTRSVEGGFRVWRVA